jgi:hypothetical protein
MILFILYLFFSLLSYKSKNSAEKLGVIIPILETEKSTLFKALLLFVPNAINKIC